jgi:hypothetical protein
MADIFISYAKRDHQYAQELAALLKDVGYDVWWDTNLVPAASFREEIAKEISAARVVIVIWSAYSARSDFVVDEADLARRSDKLMSVVLPQFSPGSVPMGFRNAHIESLDHIDKILAALKERKLKETQAASLYAMRAFADRLERLKPSRALLKYSSAAVGAAVFMIFALFLALPVLTVDLAAFHDDQISSLVAVQDYLSFDPPAAYKIEIKAGMGITRRHRYLNYSIAKNYTNQRTRLVFLTSDLRTVYDETFDTPFYAISANDGVTRVSMQIGAKSIDAAYVYVCTHFMVDDRPAHILNVQAVQIQTFDGWREALGTGDDVASLQKGYLLDKRRTPSGGYLVGSITRSALVSNAARKSIELAMPCN